MKSVDIYLFPVDDGITLEYDDQILLRFTPSDSNIISVLENRFEYIRDSAIVNIVDDDSEWLVCSKTACMLATASLSAVLEISFRESDYSIQEGSDMLSSPITLQFRNNQSPFTVRLSAVTIETAETQGLGDFIRSSDSFLETQRATEGKDYFKNELAT